MKNILLTPNAKQSILWEEGSKCHSSALIPINRLFMVQESIAKAKKICSEKLEVRRTARSLDTEITRLKFKIETQREHQGNREEIVR